MKLVGIDYGYGISLYKLEEYSLDIIRNWRNDERIFRWCRQDDLISKEAHLDWYYKQDKDPTIRMYGIWVDEGMIGVCGLTSIDLINRRAEFSLYIGPCFQGKGFSKMALKTLFTAGFQMLGLNSIWGETFEDNPAQSLFFDIGMTHDGRRREFYFKEGKFKDALLFSVLKDEWKA